MATAITAMAAMVVLAVAAIVVPIAAGGSDLDAPTPLTPRGDVPALVVEMWPWLLGRRARLRRADRSAARRLRRDPASIRRDS